MGEIKWYKRDPSAALTGMMGLSLEERGAYNTVLDLIYSRDGNLADDDRFISNWLGVDVRKWKRLKQSLIDQEKLAIVDGIVTNERATSEIDVALLRLGSLRESAAAGGRKSHGGGRKTNDLEQADAQAIGQANNNTTTTTTRKKEEEAKASPSSAGEPKFDPFPKPDWAEPQLWSDWMDVRKAKKGRKTVTAYKGFLADIAKLTNDEWPPGRLLEYAVRKSWAGIYEPKEGYPSAGRNGSQTSRPSYVNDRPSTQDIGRAVAQELGGQTDNRGGGGIVDIVPRLGASSGPQ